MCMHPARRSLASVQLCALGNGLGGGRWEGEQEWHGGGMFATMTTTKRQNAH
jgi:hypothetical protein